MRVMQGVFKFQCEEVRQELPTWVYLLSLSLF